MSHLCINAIILPRQARDKRRENSIKCHFLAGPAWSSCAVPMQSSGRCVHTRTHREDTHRHTTTQRQDSLHLRVFFCPCPIFLAVDSEFICHWPDHLPACVCAAACRSGSNYAALVRVWFVCRHGDFDLARCNDSLRRPITVRCVQHLLTTLAYNTSHASHASARRCAVPSSPCLRVTVWRA